MPPPETTPAAGQIWVDRWPSHIAAEVRHTNRHVVRVVAADPDGFVNGISWGQERLGGEWIDFDYPGAKRKTRIRTSLFARRYELLPEGSADVRA